MFRTITAVATAAMVGLTVSSGVGAQDDLGAAARGAGCSKIADSLERLNCFDQAFPKVDTLIPTDGVAIEPEQPVSVGAWQVTREKSAIDDSPKITAYLSPNEAQSGGMFQKALYVRCIENTTSVVVTTDDFQFGADTGGITYRFDSDPAVSSRWGMSDNHSAMGLWNGGTAIPFLKALRDAKTLAVRTEMQKRVDMTFDVTGVAAVIDEVAAACGWPAAKS